MVVIRKKLSKSRFRRDGIATKL